jgi:TRAP-type C4-dicarboxylate transport system substrate-binding protein
MKLGTAAPDGTSWWKVLDRMAQRWRKESNGQVDLRILPGGTQGDEGKMLDKLKLHHLQAIAISGVGLSTEVPGVNALNIPMLVDSYAGLDRVRAGLEPRLEKAAAEKGLVIINWSDVGWVHFFTKREARTPADLKRMKLFINSGDLESERLYKDMGFTPVPIPVTNLLTSLKTGMIEAFQLPPLFAQANQSVGLVNHMIQLKWAPVVGATVVDRTVWETIPEPLRIRLLKIARDTGDELRAEIRSHEDKAIRNMGVSGLTIVKPTPSEVEQWRSTAKAAQQKLRGGLIRHYARARVFYNAWIGHHHSLDGRIDSAGHDEGRIF